MLVRVPVNFLPLPVSMPHGLIQINVYPATKAPVGPPLMTLFKNVHVIQPVPVRVAHVYSAAAIVAAQIPALKIPVLSQPARKQDRIAITVVVMTRHYWAKFVLMRGRRPGNRCQHADTQHDCKEHTTHKTVLCPVDVHIHGHLLNLTVRPQDKPRHMNPDLTQVFVFINYMNMS